VTNKNRSITLTRGRQGGLQGRQASAWRGRTSARLHHGHQHRGRPEGRRTGQAGVKLINLLILRRHWRSRRNKLVGFPLRVKLEPTQVECQFKSSLLAQ
jgi:hypothetical protein